MATQAKPEGTGSIWNVNSWHWENKNYTEIAKKMVTEKLMGLVIKDRSVEIKTKSIESFKGEAQINIRKGKQILCYELNIEVLFEATGDTTFVEGTYKINDLNESDLDFEVTNINLNEKTKINDDVKSLLKKQLKKELDNLFKTLNQELMQREADPDKLEEDKKKRQEAQEKTLQAKLEKGEEKEKIFEEQKLKEKKMKEEFSQWNQAKTD